MRKWLSIALLVLSALVYAETYYVQDPSDNANASDSNAGTDIDYPWATWGHAFNESGINPGDTVFFRDGIYYHTAADGWDGYACTVDGTNGNYVYFWAYPGEEPILDSKGMAVSSTHNRGLYFRYVNWVHFKGLTIQHVEQRDGVNVDGTIECTAWHLGASTNVIIEECVVRNIHGGGFGMDRSDSVYFINCDGFSCVDSFTSVPVENPLPGNDGSAFSDFNWEDTSYVNFYRGCRAWDCGDQGFTSGSIGRTEYDSCWSFNNGKIEGGGHGFKMGWIQTIAETVTNREYINCIAAFNRRYGWDSNDGGYDCGGWNVWNNIAYHNGYTVGYGNAGIRILNTTDTDARELRRVYRNNISYDNDDADILVISGASYTHSNNTWDGGGTVTSADFDITPDSTTIRDLMAASRQADGSLPSLNGNLELTEGSDLIDAGIDVGLPYNGSAPDIGAWEYGAAAGGGSTGKAAVSSGGALMLRSDGTVMYIDQ